MTDSLADPIVSPLAAVLSVPLFELYALLWRVGVVHIVRTDEVAPRSSRTRVVAAPKGPN